jgi:hypothetical protein
MFEVNSQVMNIVESDTIRYINSGPASNKAANIK